MATTLPGSLTVGETSEKFLTNVDWTKMIKPALVVVGIIVAFVYFGR